MDDNEKTAEMNGGFSQTGERKNELDTSDFSANSFKNQALAHLIRQATHRVQSDPQRSALHREILSRLECLRGKWGQNEPV